VISIFLIGASLTAGDLDLTSLAHRQIRSRLQTVLPQVCSGSEVPAIMFSCPTRSTVIFAGRYHIPDSGFPALPTIDLAVVVSPSVTLAGQLGTGRWQNESLNSMGFYIAYFWQNPTNPDQISLGVNHTKGPEDFHFRDVSLGYLKILQWQSWALSLGGTFHFAHVDVHITDYANADDYSTTKKIEFGMINLGLIKNIGDHIKIGPNLSFSTKNLSGGFTLGGYF